VTTRLLGADLGGTGTRIVLSDETGKVLAHRSVPTSSDPTTATQHLATTLAEVADGPVHGIGIGASGPIDARGIVRNPATLPGYTGIDLVAALGDRFGVPVVVDNDAVTAAYAETRLGAGRGARSVLTVTLGTGIGVAMLTDGRPLRTPSGTHPEAGHLSMPGEAACYCGRTSCWEQQASRAALQRRAQALGFDLDTAHAHAIDGEPSTAALFAAYGAAVGNGLADLLTMLGPDLVVLGGGGARYLDAYRPALERALARVVDCYEPTQVVPALLGDLTGAIGAALSSMPTIQEECRRETSASPPDSSSPSCPGP
jgi:glucokinase